MEWLEETLEWTLYNEDFWLPGNLTWKDLESTPTARYPQGKDLLVPILFAPLMLLLRYAFERYVATNLGLALGISSASPALKRPPLPDSRLELAFRANRRPSPSEIAAISKRVDLDARRVARWFRRKNSSLRPPKIAKFNESAWRFAYYLIAFLFGVYVNYGEPWIWDTRHFWLGFPEQHRLGDDAWIYYVGVLCFYWSLVLSCFFDIQRKDFWQMLIHHVVTIILLSFSWFNNMVRIGCYIIVLHDVVDIWLEAAKIAKYCCYDRLCDFLFVTFTLIWLVSRLVVYPLFPVYSVAFECRSILDDFGAWYVFITLLLVLQVLHVFWTYMILRIVFAAVTDGELTKDSRSDTDGDSNDGDSTKSDSDSEENVEVNSNVLLNKNVEVNSNILLTKNGKLCSQVGDSDGTSAGDGGGT